MKHKHEYRLLGICKFCHKEIYGNYLNKYQAHQRWCLKNPNRNKAVEQIKNAGLIGSKISNQKKHETALIKNEKHKHICVCLKCGKQYEIWVSDKDFERGNYKKHCSYKCSNSRIHSNETKQKIRTSVRKEHKHICPKCNKEFMHNGISLLLCDDCFFEKYNRHRNEIIANKKICKTLKYKYNRIGNDVLLHKCKCEACGKTIWTKTSDIVYCYDCCKKFGKVVHQLYTPIGKKLISNFTRKKLKEIANQRIKDGKHLGWMRRNKQSYPEKFWQLVLENNKINFQREVQFVYEKTRYYFDFVIVLSNGKKIDLEIDGKQHYYDDRLSHDKLRDKRARKCGYLVYRIRWNSMTKKIGKLQMKAKIRQFLWWLNKIENS